MSVLEKATAPKGGSFPDEALNVHLGDGGNIPQSPADSSLKTSVLKAKTRAQKPRQPLRLAHHVIAPGDPAIQLDRDGWLAARANEAAETARSQFAALFLLRPQLITAGGALLVVALAGRRAMA